MPAMPCLSLLSYNHGSSNPSHLIAPPRRSTCPPPTPSSSSPQTPGMPALRTSRTASRSPCASSRPPVSPTRPSAANLPRSFSSSMVSRSALSVSPAPLTAVRAPGRREPKPHHEDSTRGTMGTAAPRHHGSLQLLLLLWPQPHTRPPNIRQQHLPDNGPGTK